MIACLLVFLASDAIAGGGVCFEGKKIAIETLAAPIEFAGEPARRDPIDLEMRVDCRSNSVLVPQSAAAAVEMLDKSLPLDFKLGIVAGEYLNPYAHTRYGASVVEDLDSYFASVWHLEDAAFCSESVLVQVNDGGCFLRSLSLLRNKYVESVNGRAVRIVVDTTSAAAHQSIGAVGVGDFSVDRRYRLILRPSLDANSSSGVFVPPDPVMATREIVKALPPEYFGALASVPEPDQNGVLREICNSGDEDLDMELRQWLVDMWRLNTQSTPLVRWYKSKGSYYGDSIAEDLMTRVCASFSADSQRR